MTPNAPQEGQAGARTVLELSYEVRRGPETLRLDIRKGRIQATRTANLYTFTYSQWAAAVAYYQQLDARREGHSGTERPES